VIAAHGDFGNVCLGAFRDLDVTVNNRGGCDLRITGIASSSGDFLTPDAASFPLVVYGGDTLALPVRFQPGGAFGLKTATITVKTDDPGHPSLDLPVTGIVPSGRVASSGSTDFGDVGAGTLAEKTLSICNVGSCDLHVSKVYLAEPCGDVRLINNPFPKPVSHDFCLGVVIRFTPTSCGPKSCSLVIVSDDLDSRTNVLTLTGNTACPDIDVAPDLGFAPNRIARARQATLTVTYVVDPITGATAVRTMTSAMRFKPVDRAAFTWPVAPTIWKVVWPNIAAETGADSLLNQRP
jgi:hypothetical protein